MRISLSVYAALTVVLTFVCHPTLAAVGPRATLKVSNKVVNPDGFKRSSTVVQGSHPGPLITAKKGETFRLNVVNDLTDKTMLRSTSIHWHGMLQHQSAWADGPVGITQCPISPGRSFQYEFTNKDKAGTHWYHSHFGTQYCDGLRGPIVIYDPQDPHRLLYDVDDESTVITLADWYHTVGPSLGGIPIADSTLINGLGRYPGGPAAPLAIINVQRGRRYRFRLVSMSCDPNYMFSIDGHDMTVIEADGENTVPMTVNAIQIFAGQRYSFVLHANQNVDNYWIRALPNAITPEMELAKGFKGGINSAILRYKGARAVDPKTTQQKKVNLLSEAKLRPLLLDPRAPGKPYPGGADVNINLDMSMNSQGFTINGKNFHEPSVPLLLQLMSGAKTAQELLPDGPLFVLPRNKVIELTMPAGVVGGPHPFHLHGHPFSVVKSAGETKPNYLNPLRRDVVSAGDIGSNVTIRFVTDNPGPWIMHCHIDFHYVNGLAVVFAEDPDSLKSKPTPAPAPAPKWNLFNSFYNLWKPPTPPAPTNPPAAWNELCPIYDALSAADTEVQLVPRSGVNHFHHAHRHFKHSSSGLRGLEQGPA
uniref:Laccase n=1 Tax=Psilocybe cubensis TaxID=181762 RepID=A0A8H7Y8Y7_PSICU